MYVFAELHKHPQDSGGWFRRRLDGGGFVLHLARSDLDLPTTAFDEFCDAVWRAAQEAKTQPVYDAGYQREIVPKREATWAQIVEADGEHEGMYVVVTLDNKVVVGVVRIRWEGTHRAVYTNVLYWQHAARRGIDIDAVLRLILDWLRSAGIADVGVGRWSAPSKTISRDADSSTTARTGRFDFAGDSFVASLEFGDSQRRFRWSAEFPPLWASDRIHRTRPPAGSYGLVLNRTFADLSYNSAALTIEGSVIVRRRCRRLDRVEQGAPSGMVVVSAGLGCVDVDIPPTTTQPRPRGASYSRCAMA